MVAKVAIDLALDRLFTYEVPETLQEKLAVGQLLCVPFGRREARGFVLEICDEKDARDYGAKQLTLKPVSAIVEETPFFRAALLELVKRVAAYTAAPIEAVLRAALPAAVVKRNARAKEQLFVEPQASRDASGLTPRQRWLWEQIVRLDGGWMRQLCVELKTTPASLRAIAALGFVTIAPRARRRDPLAGSRILPTKPLPLNPSQAKVLSGIQTLDKPLLLHGVTGSGKTEVYLQAIAAELAAGRGAIVMVPEISLTPQTVRRFASRFGDKVAVLHSALSDGERYDEWHRIRSGEARVVIGPRSVVWAPVAQLGLIIVDEEHEASYKQDDSPRYHARDVAVLRGVMEHAKVVLGSATPSFESWMNAVRGKYAYAEMMDRAGAGQLPAVRLVHMENGAIFSPDLLDAIRVRLERGEQTILFLNRRGYAPSVSCVGCGQVIACPACGVPYTYHRADSCLRCHICGGWIPVPSVCPKCAATAFDFKGIGTQRAEAALMKCFPRARVLRMDADSVARKNSHDDILSMFRRGEADILLGTQMIAKGLDFPKVTLVGVLNADSSINQPDFRAGERAYQLLTQVAGRAGRAELPGEVLIQCHDDSLPILRAVVRGDYKSFAADELASRKECFLPPFCHLAVIGLKSKDLKLVTNWSMMYAESLRKFAKVSSRRMLVGDAVPSALERADGWYRWQILIRAESAAPIIKAWRWIVAERPAPSALMAHIDIDAFHLL